METHFKFYSDTLTWNRGGGVLKKITFLIEPNELFMNKFSNKWGGSLVVIANMFNWNIFVSRFELQSRHNVLFLINSIRKGVFLAVNNLRKFTCHYKNKTSNPWIYTESFIKIHLLVEIAEIDHCRNWLDDSHYKNKRYKNAFIKD